MSAPEDTIASRLQRCQDQWNNEMRAFSSSETITTVAQAKAIDQSLDSHVKDIQESKALMSLEEAKQLHASNLSHDTSLSEWRSVIKSQLDMVQLDEWSQQWITMVLEATGLCDQDQTVKSSIRECQQTFLVHLRTWLWCPQESFLTPFAKAMQKWVIDTTELSSPHVMGCNLLSSEGSEVDKALETAIAGWTRKALTMTFPMNRTEDAQNRFSKYCTEHLETISKLQGQMTTNHQKTVSPFVRAHCKAVRFFKASYLHSITSSGDWVPPK